MTKKVESKTLKIQEELKEKVRAVLRDREGDEVVKTKDTLNFKLIDNLQNACEKSLEITETLNSNMEKLLDSDFSNIKLYNYETMMRSINFINSKLEEIKKAL